MTIEATVVLPKMDGEEIAPDVFLIGEPSVRADGKLVCLANVRGMLAVLELALTFAGNHD